ncbi:MAG TPA: cytochrome P460 family protein [Sphingomonas sp.]|nr:cytochrome P460 family protein [Sphingomonas sp.]
MVSRADSAAAMAAAIFLIGAIASRPARNRSNASPVFGVGLPSDYRRWPVIGVAHEAGKLNDIRVVLGNDRAIKAYRSGMRPFPDGAALVRIAWKLVPSARNNAIFGQAQSFVAGEPTTVQIEVKDSKKYPDTGGWGYAQFENGEANKDVALIRTCFACHAKLPAAEDFIFTPYSR